MKVLLVNAPPIKMIGITGQIYPPLGILYLASYVRSKRNDLDISVLDGYVEDKHDFVNKIIDFAPDVLGVSFTTQAASGAFALIKEVKQRNKNIFIVIGGPHTTAMPEDCFDKSQPDIAVLGEGEKTFDEILTKFQNAYADISSIAGTMVKKNGVLIRNNTRPLIENLDELPFPARDLVDIRKYPGYMYKKFSRDTSLLSARGCPFNCLYCSNPVWKQQKPWYRLRSPKNVADEMQFIKDEYNIREFFDQTDEFNGSKKWAEQMCDEIISRDMDIVFKAQMRVDNVDGELVAKLKKAGLWMVLFGLESCHDRTLKGINKKQTREMMDRAMDTFKETGIKCFGLFMGFNVWETDGRLCYENKADTLCTLSYIKNLIKDNKLHLFGWSMTTPYPGSQLYDIAIRHNLIDRKYIGNWEYFDSGSIFIMKLPDVSSDDWAEVINSGKKLQAKMLLRSGTFNIKSIPIYVKKAWYLTRQNIQRKYEKIC
ncbi:MAG: cobalamin-dependent protein [Anaerohalosphaera sp.]|nr:cobalamin-dependent protein [Anaerohalosphaera sp.]